MSFIGREWSDVIDKPKLRLAWIVQSYMSFFEDFELHGGPNIDIDFFKARIQAMMDMLAQLDREYAPTHEERKVFSQLSPPVSESACRPVVIFLSVAHAMLNGVSDDVLNATIVNIIRTKQTSLFFSFCGPWTDTKAVTSRSVRGTEIERYLIGYVSQ